MNLSRGSDGGRKSGRGGGCRDVLECARVLSNVNLTKEEEQDGGGRFQTDMCECEGVIPDDNVTRESKTED